MTPCARVGGNLLARAPWARAGSCGERRKFSWDWEIDACIRGGADSVPRTIGSSTIRKGTRVA